MADVENQGVQHAEAPRAGGRGRSSLWACVIGIVVGAALVCLIGWMAMPQMMLKTHASAYGLDETCERLKAAIEEQGWTCPAIRNMNASIEKEGATLARQVRIVELCQADYAQRILSEEPQVSTLMPCAFGVYEGDDGKTYVSAMNTGLMGRMFGGVIAEVMGGSVAADETEILAAIGHE